MLLLSLIDAHMQITALRLALEDQGILTPAQKDSAMRRAKEIWGPRRKSVEAIPTTGEIQLEDFLPPPEEPIQ